jgi:hypothetical protein
MRHPRFPAAANIGLELGSQLAAVGVDSLDRLTDVGAREAWLRLRVQYPARGDLQSLLALQGAIDDVLVPKLPAPLVAELRHWWRSHTDDA